MPAVRFKADATRRHHVSRRRHRVTNRAGYDAASRRRGSPTAWLTDAAIAAWRAEPRTTMTLPRRGRRSRRGEGDAPRGAPHRRRDEVVARRPGRPQLIVERGAERLGQRTQQGGADRVVVGVP